MRRDGYEDYDGEKVEWEDFTNERTKRRAQKRELKKALKKKNKKAYQDWKRKINNGGE